MFHVCFKNRATHALLLGSVSGSASLIWDSEAAARRCTSPPASSAFHGNGIGAGCVEPRSGVTKRLGVRGDQLQAFVSRGVYRLRSRARSSAPGGFALPFWKTVNLDTSIWWKAEVDPCLTTYTDLLDASVLCR